MSVLAVDRPARALPRPVTRTDYLQLVVARRPRAARAPFVVAVVLLLGSGLLGLLVLNTVLAQGAFRLHTLQVQGRLLADREQALQRAVEGLQSPQSLADRATALGMVPGGPPVFLRLPDGAVLGTAIPAAAPPAAPKLPPAAHPSTPAAPAAPGASAAQPPALGGWVAVPANPPTQARGGTR